MFRSFFSPSSDLAHLPLSGFSHSGNNHVDTLFSVPGLDDLPPILERRTSIENNPPISDIKDSLPSHKFPHSPTVTRPTKTKSIITPSPFPSRKTYQTKFQPSGSFPAIFDHFKNFFNFKALPNPRRYPVAASNASPSKEITTTVYITTPRTSLSTTTTTKFSTTSSTQGPLQDDSSFLSVESVYEYDDHEDVTSDYQHSYDNTYEDYEYQNSKDKVTEDYPKITNSQSPSCPGSLRECLTACSPVIKISKVAYKLCVNECLDRC